MQWHNDTESSHLYDRNERPGYTGTSQPYETFSGQTFQQQILPPPMSGYGPIPHNQQTFSGNPPLSDSRFAAILSYSFGWLTGLLFLIFGGKNRFIRFHALQSLVFFGTMSVIDVGLLAGMYMGEPHLIGLLLVGIVVLLMLNFIAFVSWIVVMVQAARGVYFKLPFVGELVARCLNWKSSSPHW